MTGDVGHPGGPARGARRPGTVLTGAVAAVLLLGGGGALAVGLSDRDAVPPPLVAAGTTPTTATTPDTGTAGAPRPADAEPGDPEPADTEPGAVPGPPADLTAPTAGPSTSDGPEPTETVAPAAAPVTVRIPAIGVTSDLLHLGLADDGTLAVPEGDDFDRAAWFDGSPRPGDVGPAVIEGHVSSRARGPSVFFELATLAPGDTVEVDREDGTTATFEVYELQQYAKDSFPTLAVYGNTAGPELRLITCGGTVSDASGHFTDNIVVFAREV